VNFGLGTLVKHAREHLFRSGRPEPSEEARVPRRLGTCCSARIDPDPLPALGLVAKKERKWKPRSAEGLRFEPLASALRGHLLGPPCFCSGRVLAGIATRLRCAANRPEEHPAL